MPKVHVVVTGAPYESQVAYLFTSRLEAEEVKDNLNADYANAEVWEYDLDPKMSDHASTTVYMTFDGALFIPCTKGYDAKDSYMTTPYLLGMSNDAVLYNTTTGNSRMRIAVPSHDEQEAIKKANETRLALQRVGLWVRKEGREILAKPHEISHWWKTGQLP